MTAIADHLFILYDDNRAAWRGNLASRTSLSRGVWFRGYEQRKGDDGVLTLLAVFDAEYLSLPNEVYRKLSSPTYMAIRTAGVTGKWIHLREAKLVSERGRNVGRGRVELLDAVIEGLTGQMASPA